MNLTTSNAELRRYGRETVDDAAQAAERVREATRIAVGRLTADVAELVKKLANVTDTDVARIRDKVQETLAATRNSLEVDSGRIRSGGRRVVTATDTYVHERPWTAIGIAVAAAGLITALAARRH